MAEILKDGLPASAFLIVENQYKIATWHLPVLGSDGKPDHARMGSAFAALHGGLRGNKYEGAGKAEAITKLKKLYEQENMTLPASKNFAVFKQANGLFRWVTFSGSAFVDRDGETILAKAIEDDIDRSDGYKEYGPLRWWHLGAWNVPDGPEKWETWKAGPGVDLGTCDFQMLHGKMLIESGTFKTQELGEAFSNIQEILEVSISFSHPVDEPGDSKEFHNVHILERSLLPEGYASNMLTKFYVSKGDPNMKALDKLKALAAILKDKPELAAQILADSEAVQKAADAAGLSSKEVTEMFTVEDTPVTEVAPVIPEPIAVVIDPSNKEMSLEQRAIAARDAIYAIISPEMSLGAMEVESGYITEVYDTYAILRQGDKNFRMDYTLDASGKATIGTPIEVEQDWKPIGKELGKFMAPEEKAAAVPTPTPEAPPDEIGNMSRQQLADFCAGVYKQLNAPDPAASAKEVQQEQLISDMAVSVKELADRITPIGETMTGIKQTLSELTGAQPVGVKQLMNLRPSANDSNVIDTAPAGPTLAPSFVKFAQGGK